MLGVVSDQERREVECMSKIYPELLEHLQEVQGNLEILSDTWRKEPPQELKIKVMEAIRKEKAKEPKTRDSAPQAKVISMQESTNKNGNFSKWVAAASVILVLGAASLFFLKTNELKKVEAELRAQEETIRSTEHLVAELQKEVDSYNAGQAFMTDDQTISVALAGTPKSPESKVKAYWNKDKNQVLLAGVSLPKHEADKQYQLWAIVDGKPVDLGMLDAQNPSQPIFKKVQENQVQAFAITLEKKGGSPTPNLDQLYVIGNVGT